jgi:isopentenyl diphosphate isomerase/L-lactate dehydrogenase-like FMN-dependent dehydrogenase
VDLRWEHIALLRKMTKLKVIIKGVLNIEDALIANDFNIDAIWISNHGGRQLDTATLSFAVLPRIKN